MSLSIRSIAELVGGQLRFGPLPPLDGQSETVQRILPSCQRVRQRDVVLWCGQSGNKHAEAECFLEEAFLRGALGVIAMRSVAPLAGCFCLRVADPHVALCQLASQLARQACGQRVLIVDSLTPSPLYHLLCHAIQQEPAEFDFAATLDSLDSMRWQIIGLDTDRTHTVIHTTELPNSDWHHWFRPDVVVITRDAFASPWSNRIQQFLSSPHKTATRAELVVPANRCIATRGCWQRDITTYGWHPGSHVQGHASAIGLSRINGIPIRLPGEWTGAEEAVLAAVATLRAMGLDEQSFILDWIQQGEQRRAS